MLEESIKEKEGKKGRGRGRGRVLLLLLRRVDRACNPLSIGPGCVIPTEPKTVGSKHTYIHYIFQSERKKERKRD